MDIDWARVWPDREYVTPTWKHWISSCEKPARYELATLDLDNQSAPLGNHSKRTRPGSNHRLVLLLAERYQQNHLSIELFPGANTIQGWGAEPDPIAYNNLLKSCWKALQSSGSPVLLVAGGLEPLASKPVERAIWMTWYF